MTSPLARRNFLQLMAALTAVGATGTTAAAAERVSNQGGSGRFPLVSKGKAATIVVSGSDHPGVVRVATADQRGTLAGYEVESERGRDIRRELARSIVNRGWGLLELRPMRMSLEEIFLQVTTDETAPEAAAPAPIESTEEAARD